MTSKRRSVIATCVRTVDGAVVLAMLNSETTGSVVKINGNVPIV